MEEPFIGEVDIYGFNFVPDNWTACNGALLAVVDFQALFALIGTYYGGDGRSTFGVPDLRGRMAISQGEHPGSRYDWKMGKFYGEEVHTMSSAELPKHSHLAAFTPSGMELQVSTDIATSDVASDGDFLAQADIAMYRANAGSGTVPLGGVYGGGGAASVAVDTAGAGKQFGIMQPMQALNYCMAMEGLFPSRS
ncbi:Phage Tail Collar Domain protein [Marinomonas spartinae]|uniref:Phage Tail Collar Domain protein n=1 Tax=Marinomonas spartinae TaxID=1792290 RepID=A0A1A8TF40_9GAMM|nr:tail fiber protein [Marinomonas spartinae]SBS30748.1 Phage Tail Collar Domain protein [Marinomonas spartinae]